MREQIANINVRLYEKINYGSKSTVIPTYAVTKYYIRKEICIMNNKNENFKKTIKTLRTDIIYSLIFTILEAGYFIYNLSYGIVMPQINIISTLIGIHLGINIIALYRIYKILKS